MLAHGSAYCLRFMPMPLQAHCHRDLGTLYAAIGQREQARAALSAAVAMHQSMAMTLWLPQTEAARAQVERAH